MTRDSAVSPVIATILLVAITVIIAAVIAAFVFGMAGDIQQTRIVVITSDVAQGTTDKETILTNHGGKDIAALQSFEVLVNGTPCSSNSAAAILSTLKRVGSSVKVNSTASGICSTTVGITPNFRSHLVVVGTFADGSKQILLDTYQ